MLLKKPGGSGHGPITLLVARHLELVIVDQPRGHAIPKTA